MYQVRVVFLMLMAALSLSMQAQERITGYVIDDEAGDSLGFVSVQYKDTKQGAIADHRGYFSVPKRVGAKLVFSAVGYRTRTVTVKETSHRLLIALKPDLKSLSEVTV